MKIFSYIFILLCLLIPSFLSAQNINIPEPINPPRLVNDFASTFSQNEQINLEKILQSYNDSTSTQIYIVTIKDLDGYDISDYTTLLGQKWGIGQKYKNNGLVILINPKTYNKRGHVFIATGYGIESILNDARCGRIIRNCMLPDFKNNDYYSGTLKAINEIQNYLSGNFKSDGKTGSNFFINIIIGIGIVTLIVIIIIRSNNKNNNGQNGSGGGGYLGGLGGFGYFGSDGDDNDSYFGGPGGGSFGGGGAGDSF